MKNIQIVIAETRQKLSPLDEAKKEALTAYRELEYEKILGKYEPAYGRQYRNRIKAARSENEISRIMAAAGDKVDQYYDQFFAAVKAGEEKFSYNAYGDPNF